MPEALVRQLPCQLEHPMLTGDGLIICKYMSDITGRQEAVSMSLCERCQKEGTHILHRNICILVTARAARGTMEAIRAKEIIIELQGKAYAQECLLSLAQRDIDQNAPGYIPPERIIATANELELD